MFLKHFVRDLQLVTKEHPTARSVVYSYSDVDTRCLVNPGGPPPPSPRLSSPVLSLSPSCHLHSPAHCNPLLHQLLSESPAFIPPPWNMAAVSGEIDTTAYLYCCSLSRAMSPGSHTQTFPWPFKQWPIWGQLQVAPRLQYHALEIGKYLKILLVRYSNCIFPCVVI